MFIFEILFLRLQELRLLAQEIDRFACHLGVVSRNLCGHSGGKRLGRGERRRSRRLRLAVLTPQDSAKQAVSHPSLRSRSAHTREKPMTLQHLSLHRSLDLGRPGAMQTANVSACAGALLVGTRIPRSRAGTSWIPGQPDPKGPLAAPARRHSFIAESRQVSEAIVDRLAFLG